MNSVLHYYHRTIQHLTTFFTDIAFMQSCSKSKGLVAILWQRWLVSSIQLQSSRFNPRPVRENLWWTKWHWDRFLTEYFSSLSVLLYQRSIPIYFYITKKAESIITHHKLKKLETVLAAFQNQAK